MRKVEVSHQSLGPAKAGGGMREYFSAQAKSICFLTLREKIISCWSINFLIWNLKCRFLQSQPLVRVTHSKCGNVCSTWICVRGVYWHNLAIACFVQPKLFVQSPPSTTKQTKGCCYEPLMGKFFFTTTPQSCSSFFLSKQFDPFHTNLPLRLHILKAKWQKCKNSFDSITNYHFISENHEERERTFHEKRGRIFFFFA